MAESSRYAEKWVLWILLLILTGFLFFFGGAIFIGILRDVAA